MGLLTGYICLILLVLLLLKYISQRFNFTKLNTFLRKTHKFAAYGFLIVTIIHFILVIPVLDTRAFIVSASGIAMMVFGLLLTIFCHTLKDRKKEIKFHKAFSLVIFVMLLAHIVFYVVDFKNYLTAMNNISVSEVDLNTIDDGEYIGEYDAGYIYAKVKITIKDHTISNVELLEHNHERGIKSEKALPDIIKNEQKIDVDTVSGATNSSRVIKQACMNALVK